MADSAGDAGIPCIGSFLTDLDEFWNPPWRGWLSIFLIAIGAFLVIFEIRSSSGDGIKKYSGPTRSAEVAEYMITLVNHDGRCVMSSNDLSWAQGDKDYQRRAARALEQKASQGSLELVMPTPSDYSSKLEKLGADVHYYGSEGFKLKSRFTIVNVERSDEWVAIGHGDRDSHYIHEVDSPNDPAGFLASDLVKLAQRYAAMLNTKDAP